MKMFTMKTGKYLQQMTAAIHVPVPKEGFPVQTWPVKNNQNNSSSLGRKIIPAIITEIIALIKTAPAAISLASFVAW